MIGASGTTIRGRDGARVQFLTVDVGRGATWAPLSDATPTGTGTAEIVLARHAGSVAVTEWWRNAPGGVEQGFTVQSRPAGTGALEIQQDVQSALTMAVLDGGDGVRFLDGDQVRLQRAANCVRQDVRFILHPKGSNRVGPQVMIDTPAPDAEFGAGQPILIAGWAIDLDDTVGTGVSTVHSWAYPVTATGHDAPIFLGIAAYGGQRADVGAIFGERFAGSAYDLLAPPLPPGTHDIAVFAWSTANHEFVPAKVVRVVVR